MGERFKGLMSPVRPHQPPLVWLYILHFTTMGVNMQKW